MTDEPIPDRDESTPPPGERPGLRRFAVGAEPMVGRVASAARAAVGAAVDRWEERPGARVRRLRRLSRTPLSSLYDVHPEARLAHPREVGLRSIDVDRILGTAVGGGSQRGADFLPLKPFRSTNWAARWQRIRAAVDRMAILPPIDVVRYGEGYWLLDGHNRVAAALYAGQVEIDANVTELVPPGATPVEPRGTFATAVTASRALRSAGIGRGGGGLHEDSPIPHDDAPPGGDPERDGSPDEGAADRPADR